MGGMNDDNFLEYNPQILQYDSEKARQDKLEAVKKLREKQKLEELKLRLQNTTNLSKSDLKKKRMLENLENESMNKSGYSMSQSEEEEQEQVLKPKEPSIPDELLQIIRIKTEPNFISFQPLPDPFHDVVNQNRNP